MGKELDIHCQITAQRYNPDGPAHELDDGYGEDGADDHGRVAGPAGGVPPFRIAFPGEVVETEGGHDVVVYMLQVSS